MDSKLEATVHRHLRIGWWALLFFLTLGLVLEALHGFKVGWYLDLNHATRRLMWTLAHAHGVLISLVNVAFAFTLTHFRSWDGRGMAWASAALRFAIVFLPGGFLLGGFRAHGGDPGLGILLVPVGGLALFIAVLATARRASLGIRGGTSSLDERARPE